MKDLNLLFLKGVVNDGVVKDEELKGALGKCCSTLAVMSQTEET